MSVAKEKVLLIDLPTYPKGSVALSLYAVAAAFDPWYSSEIIDLNFLGIDAALHAKSAHAWAIIGLKVSAQNFKHAVSISKLLKEQFPEVPVLWGGELPTLLSEECLKHCEVIVRGSFEPVAEELCLDLQQGKLKAEYQGRFASNELATLLSPRLDLIPQPERYPAFMGWPMESSRGCTFKCTFCMVHSMQPSYQTKSLAQLESELKAYKGRFLNLVDYNFGLDKAHLLKVAKAIGESGVVGWMGEMCLESLDDDEVLEALAASRCRMIYCGLEAVDEMALKSINKARTNQIGNYERIIRKVQSHGVQIAAGLIIGLEGSSLESFEKMHDFFQRMDIAYVKLTFLTYNPGTKVKESMQRKGSYVTEEIDQFDGNHLTFLANGLDPDMLFEGSRKFIRSFYSVRKIVGRAIKSEMNFLGKMELMLFNFCYREVYLEWVANVIFRNEIAFQELLAKSYAPSWQFRLADRLLKRVRSLRFKQ